MHANKVELVPLRTRWLENNPSLARDVVTEYLVKECPLGLIEIRSRGDLRLRNERIAALDKRAANHFQSV